MASIDDILAVASDPAHRREATVRILLREDLRNQHAGLNAELHRKSEEFVDDVLKPEAVQELAHRVKALEDEIAAVEVEFRFRALPYRDWMALIAKHPPTDEQLKGNRRLDHNPDTFRPAAIAASCVDPEMTLEQASQLRDVLAFDTFLTLWATCHTVNTGGDLGKSMLAGLILRQNGASATTPASEAFPAASSSAES
jgi:hypothetical protein